MDLLMSGLNFKLDFDEDKSAINLTIIPVTFRQVYFLFEDEEILEIERIHLCLWDENDHLWIVNNECTNVLNSIASFSDIASIVDGYDEENYSVNKLFVRTGNFRINYDDDSFLELEYVVDKKNLECELSVMQNICLRYIQEAINIKNIDVLW
mgnify:CR=1 FL=1